MITYHIKVIITCPECGYADLIDCRGMGETHKNWISDKQTPWTCRKCRKDVTGMMSGGQAEMEGTK